MARGISITLEGMEPLERSFKKMGPSVRAEVQKAVALILLRIVTESQGLISRGGRTGVIYRRRSVTHQASAAGEPPKTDRGGLVRNITLERDGDGLGGNAGSRKAAPQGFWMEMGTTFIKPRPWLSTVWQKLQDFINTKMDQAVGSGVDKAMQ